MLEAWVAGTGEIPVAGHAIISRAGGGPHCRPVAELGRLFVDPAARHQGVARALIRHAKHWAAARDLDLVLWVTDHLTAAQQLYASAGFARTGTETARWTAPDGSPVTVHRYDWSYDGRRTPRNR
jgi:GNAT superfamily N-acetyltransferase